MGDGDAHRAVVQIISDGNTHVRLLEAILADGDTGVEGDLFEVAVAIVAVEVVRLAIVGDEEVELAIVVEVGPDGGETEEVLGIVDAGGFGDLGEGAVAVVAVERVGRTLEAARTALHGDVVILAGLAEPNCGRSFMLKST